MGTGTAISSQPQQGRPACLCVVSVFKLPCKSVCTVQPPCGTISGPLATVLLPCRCIDLVREVKGLVACLSGSRLRSCFRFSDYVQCSMHRLAFQYDSSFTQTLLCAITGTS